MTGWCGGGCGARLTDALTRASVPEMRFDVKHAKRSPNQEGVIKFTPTSLPLLFRRMAGSKFAYVRNFELPDPLLPETYIVLRIDGHSFHRQF